MREVAWASLGTPLALSMLSVDIPWQGYLALASVCSVLYICRLIVVWRLGTTALSKAGPTQVPATTNAIMRAISRQPRQP